MGQDTIGLGSLLDIAYRERDAIIKFCIDNPLEGYRRLTFMMLDRDIVAVSPASVWRVLSSAGLLDRWNNTTAYFLIIDKRMLFSFSYVIDKQCSCDWCGTAQSPGHRGSSVT